MRVGTTSFIHPAGWLHNVELLAPHYDDIEILFFEAGGAGAFPSREECRGLYRCKREHDLSYSLHTPLDVSLASEDAERRRMSVQAVLRAMHAAQAFEPEAFIVHVYLGDSEHGERPRDVQAWRDRASDSLTRIVASGVEPSRVCVESLDYDFALIEPVLRDLNLSIALDVGHLARDGLDELAALDRYLPRTRVVQWHGTAAGDRDHRSLVHYPRERARALVSELVARRYAGVLTLEVFSESDLTESSALVRALFSELPPDQELPAWARRASGFG